MHRVIKSFLTSFVEQFQLDDYDEGKQFEFFRQHCIVQPKVGSSLDGDSLAIDRSDNGIDGLAIVVDGDLIYSLEDIENLFGHSARKFEVEIIFIQAKGGETFDLGMFSRLCNGVSRFSTEFDARFNSDYLNEPQSIFKFILDNAHKVRDSLPKFTSYYVTTGRYYFADEWEDEKR